jgi:uncharacterized membrane protein
MGYAVLKSVHLLALVVWIGGMFFTVACLRPALAAIDAPQRLRLMHEVLRRFFGIVSVAATLVLLSGLWMLLITARVGSAAGLGFHMPIDWHVMVVGGIVMLAIFGHLRFAVFGRLRRAAAAADGAGAAAALAQIRRWVAVNLALGVAIVVVMKLGAAA